MQPGALLPTKATVILIRWPVVLISSALILFRSAGLPLSVLLDLAVILYALSNAGLYFVSDHAFRRVRFNILLVGLDTVVLTASLVVSGQVESHFYLAYFLLIIICCIFENPRMIVIVSFAAPVVYAATFFESEDFRPGNYLQLAFLFVVGLFYGHFAQLVRAQQRLTERAEQRNRARSELLNILSHELKTPLTVIASYAQALKSSALGSINAGQEEALDRILRQSRSLENLVNVILESASVETGVVAAQCEELVLSEFLDELRQYCDRLPINPEVKLVWDYPTPLPVVRSDPTKLKIILQNLINNSVKFTDVGDIRVQARHDPLRKKMVFTVADSGIGIAPDQLPFVFDKFWQADAARTRTQSGIGMGLYIVKAFTELLGGTVSIDSTLNKGTCVVVELPSNP
ncbi:MAG TPA: HAMP domain-containing sensor histidine kinase [Candidatus Binatia bacterium]|nr:HAMP domain-containing sensor histidine kinase [Candidatus Binatia bacterium]